MKYVKQDLEGFNLHTKDEKIEPFAQQYDIIDRKVIQNQDLRQKIREFKQQCQFVHKLMSIINNPERFLFHNSVKFVQELRKNPEQMQLLLQYRNHIIETIKIIDTINNPEKFIFKQAIKAAKSIKDNSEMQQTLKEYLKQSYKVVQYSLYLSNPELFVIKKVVDTAKKIKENSIFNLEAEDNEYIVNFEDNLSEIAKRFDITIEDLLTLNPQLNDRFSKDKSIVNIYTGERIKLPEGVSKDSEKFKSYKEADYIREYVKKKRIKEHNRVKEWIRRIRESELHREEELQRLRMIPPGFQKRITTNGKPYYTDGFSYYINRQDLHEEIEHVFQQGLEDFITRMGFVRYNYN